MPDDRGPARLAKWPFYVADILLCAVIFVVLYQLGTFEGTGEMMIVGVCLAAAAIAAWISILPWLKEHDAAVHLSETTNLRSALEQVKSVEKVADLMRQSNIQWQGVQEACARTVASANDITEKMKLEADEFMKFISQAHDQERTGLRLEVEKLRRMEGDWVKVSVQMLDHVFALTRAAERSGQAQLIKQLHQFQTACRDVARRMGLTGFVPAIGEPFDQRAHQLPNPQTSASEGDKIQDILAPGFTYQGQLLRRSLVMVGDGRQEEQEQIPAGEIATETADEPAVEPPIESPPPSVETESVVPEMLSEAEEPPAFNDEAKENPSNETPPDQTDEPPAIIDTYNPNSTDSTEAAVESAEAAPAGRRKKRTDQQDLPF
ncbi:MAG TPA: nucleotide exchange factor GrpE [Verrucomicrobiae bacterium]